VARWRAVARGAIGPQRDTLRPTGRVVRDPSRVRAVLIRYVYVTRSNDKMKCPASSFGTY
jgi:hypothetical protein